MEKVGGKTGIYIIIVGLQLILSIFLPDDRQCKTRILSNYRRISVIFGIASVYVTIRTVRADFCAAMPWIPG